MYIIFLKTRAETSLCLVRSIENSLKYETGMKLFFPDCSSEEKNKNKKKNRSVLLVTNKANGASIRESNTRGTLRTFDILWTRESTQNLKT